MSVTVIVDAPGTAEDDVDFDVPVNCVDSTVGGVGREDVVVIGAGGILPDLHAIVTQQDVSGISPKQRIGEHGEQAVATGSANQRVGSTNQRVAAVDVAIADQQVVPANLSEVALHSFKANGEYAGFNFLFRPQEFGVVSNQNVKSQVSPQFIIAEPADENVITGIAVDHVVVAESRVG